MQLADFLNTPRRLRALGHVASDEARRLVREQLDEKERLWHDARNLTLLERAKGCWWRRAAETMD